MTQVTGPLTIKDGTSPTPVDKSFAPVKVSPQESTFAEKSSAVSAGYKTLNISFSPASGNRPTNRINLKLAYPVLQTVGTVSSVAYTGRFEGYFVIPDVMTASERADLAAFVANALDNASIRAVLKDLDPLY